MKKGLLVVLVAVIALLAFVAPHINSVPKLDEVVKEQWSQVQNQYKRRADLIPNLVETVKAYAEHEQETLNQVTEARTKVGQINVDASMIDNPQQLKQFNDAQQALSSSLGRLIAVAEDYPDLKANENFRDLQAQLEGTENRIAVARRDYIAAVRAYNTELRTIPGRWVASFLYPEAEVRPTFEASEAEQSVPEVSFN
ncbi:LemA family protein [Suttonella sp. R2A3]|uniref:LemA family protein n=1 Tax=Suttonella sp. R2A3 TaxID=2908648 RepID=UPI001F1DA353|nr:LemA family protein [Suttonella sp. R2A3]UJF23855.1 LemA family protein [Suttonella sp. R2A3]